MEKKNKRKEKKYLRSCGDSNLGPFDHKAGALTNKPSLLPRRNGPIPSVCAQHVALHSKRKLKLKELRRQVL